MRWVGFSIAKPSPPCIPLPLGMPLFQLGDFMETISYFRIYPIGVIGAFAFVLLVTALNMGICELGLYWNFLRTERMEIFVLSICAEGPIIFSLGFLFSYYGWVAFKQSYPFMMWASAIAGGLILVTIIISQMYFFKRFATL